MTNILTKGLNLNKSENSNINFRDKMKGIFGALGWFGLFCFTSMVLVSLYLNIGYMANWSFVIDGSFAMVDVLDGSLDPEISKSASHYVLSTLWITYLPALFAMFLFRKGEDVFKEVNIAELLKYSAIFGIFNLISNLVMSYVCSLPQFVEEAATFIAASVLPTSGNILLCILTTGIMVPIAEEIIFRRGIQKNLSKISPVLGIAVSAILFGVIHGNYIQGIFAIISGLIFGIVYHKTNNLCFTTAMHMTVNLSAILITKTGVNEILGYILISLVLYLAYLVLRNNDIVVCKEKQSAEKQIEKATKLMEAGKGIVASSSWVLLFIGGMFASTFLIMVLGVYFDIDFIIDSIYAMNDFISSIGTSTFSELAKELANNCAVFIHIAMCIGYLPVIIAMVVRRSEEGGFKSISKTEISEVFKWLTISMAASFALDFIMQLFCLIPYFAKQADTLSSVGMLSTAGLPWLAFMTTGVLAPIVEEIAFRRGIQKNMTEKFNPTVGILIASVSFGVVHFNLFQGVFATLMGIVLGYIYYKTDNLWYTTIIHIVNNSASVLITLLGLNAYAVGAAVPIIAFILYLATKNDYHVSASIPNTTSETVVLGWVAEV